MHVSDAGCFARLYERIRSCRLCPSSRHEQLQPLEVAAIKAPVPGKQTVCHVQRVCADEKVADHVLPGADRLRLALAISTVPLTSAAIPVPDPPPVTDKRILG